MGILDLMLDIFGFLECWGIFVIYCFYCYGYEYYGKKMVILVNGECVFYLVFLVNNLIDDFSLLIVGEVDFIFE